MVALADHSYLTWQGVLSSLAPVSNHLSCHSGQYPSDTPESWDNGQPIWVPYCEGLPRHFGGLSIFSGRGPHYYQGGGPYLPKKRSPGPSGPPGEVP